MSWNNITVGDLIERAEAEVKTGPFGTQLRASDYVETGTPVINVRNIGFGNIRHDKLEYIPDDVVTRLSGHLLRKGDIVFGRKGAVERHVYITDAQNRWFQGSDCLRLRLLSEANVLSKYLSFTFLTHEHQSWMMQQCSHGATMASLNQDIIKRIPLRLPSIEQQKIIVDILSTYDDLIENNTRRIEILEEMARRLYEEWFVHFRFPGHEEVSFKESELGEIPANWEVVQLKDIANNFDRKRKPLSKKQRSERQGNYPYYGAAKIFDYIDDYLFDGRYLLLAEDGSVIDKDGFPVLQVANGRFWANNHTHILQGKPPASTEFLFLALSRHPISGYITGAAQPKITQANMNRIPLVVGDLEIHTAFDRLIKPMFDMQETLEKKNANLRAQRDLLLPKLVSGEIDVSDITMPEDTEVEAA